MFQFPGLASHWISGLQPEGLPHSDIFGSKVVCTSPTLIAAYHVLHRLHLPRHPLYALYYLTILFNPFQFPHEIGNLLHKDTYFTNLRHILRTSHSESFPTLRREDFSMNFKDFLNNQLLRHHCQSDKLFVFGGGDQVRTGDPMLAKHVLSS